MKSECDWKVIGLLFAPSLISLFGFAWVHDQIGEMRQELKDRPIIMQQQPSACIRSQNKFGWWQGSQEINCNG